MHRMATKKRRIVYLTDQEWEAARRQSRPFLMSASTYIASLITGGRIIPAAVVEEAEEKVRDIARGMTQAERDAILRRINKGG